MEVTRRVLARGSIAALVGLGLAIGPVGMASAASPTPSASGSSVPTPTVSGAPLDVPATLQPATAPAFVLLPLKASGWDYHQVAWGAESGFQAPNYDQS